VRPEPSVPRGGARVLHECDAAPEPPPRLPRPPGARYASELPAALVVAPQRGVLLEERCDEPCRLGPVNVILIIGGGGAAVGEDIGCGLEGLPLR
jgi:hypothetical protein